MNSTDKSNNSLCDTSMKMVVNIVKQSSFSIAKMSLGTTGPPVVTKKQAPVMGSVIDHNKALLLQVPGSRRLQEPQTSSKPFVMQPGGGNGSSCVIRKGNSVDGMASDYIRKVHEKNNSEAHEMSEISPLRLHPPPRVVK